MDADGIEHLLGVDDPTERKLALKSRHVDPYHLRIALQDEDPQVREAAANHPGLTPELMHEIIHGEDRWLASVLLKRPDLTEEQLAHAADHHDLHAHIAEHPALTDDLRQKLVSDPATASGLQDELAKTEPLSKNIGHLLYPHFGEGNAHHTSVYYPSKPDKIDRQSAGAGVGYAQFNFYPSKGHDLPAHRKQMRLRIFKPGKKGEARPVDEAVRRRVFGEAGTDTTKLAGQFEVSREVLRGKMNHAHEQHEVQHGILGRLAQRYGGNGRDAIIKETFKRLPEKYRLAIRGMFMAHSEGFYPKKDRHEEMLAHIQNYLMDPAYRRKVHVGQRIHNNVPLQREQFHWIRKAWQELQRVAQNLKPEDVGLVRKSDQEILNEAVERLAKAREVNNDSVIDHLGFDEKRHTLLQAVEFLTGKPVDPDIFRARLMDTDDEIEAALLAGGLRPEDRSALEAVMSVQSVSKAEPRLPKQILPGNHSAAKMASDLQWSIDNRQVESVALAGKHSAGTLMARDRDGDLYLLKPGSGKQSPAAGAAEEKASQSRREAAYSALAQEMHISQVPNVELLMVDGKEVAGIRMLGLDWTGLARAREQDAGLPRRVLRPYLDDGTIYKWAILDYIAGNPDRHGNNLMVGPEGRVALIDHGSAFAGPSFSPGHDSKSFVPYYLRVWGPDKGWARMAPEERMRVLPVLSPAADNQVKEWLDGLDTKKIVDVIYHFGVDPTPLLHRLQAVRAAVDNGERLSEVVNRFWVL